MRLRAEGTSGELRETSVQVMGVRRAADKKGQLPVSAQLFFVGCVWRGAGAHEHRWHGRLGPRVRTCPEMLDMCAQLPRFAKGSVTRANDSVSLQLAAHGSR
jgi:hypothetical protein